MNTIKLRDAIAMEDAARTSTQLFERARIDFLAATILVMSHPSDKNWQAMTDAYELYRIRWRQRAEGFQPKMTMDGQ